MAWTDKYCSVAGSGAADGSSAGNAWTLAGAIAGAAAGNRVNMLAGTYSNTSSSITFSTAGSATAPIWWRGYKTSIGDQDSNNVAVAGTDIPSITFTTGHMIVSGAHQIFSNLDISGAYLADGTGQVSCGAVATAYFYRVRMTNTAANSSGRTLDFSGSGAVNLIACYIKATTTADFAIVAGTYNTLLGTIVTGGTIGLNISTGQVINCVFDSQAGDAIKTIGSVTVANCSFYAPGGHGINASSAAQSLFANNYFENVNQAGKFGISNTTGTASDLFVCVGNAFFNCTGNYNGTAEAFVIFDNGTLASQGFVAPTSQNFGLNSIAQKIGFPGVNEEFENTAVYSGYLSVGAVQPNPSGGSAGIIVGPGWQGGFRG